MPKRDRVFITLDFWETGDAIWALGRECERIRMAMRQMDQAAQEETRPLLTKLDALHGRLSQKYAPARAKILSNRPCSESTDAR